MNSKMIIYLCFKPEITPDVNAYELYKFFRRYGHIYEIITRKAEFKIGFDCITDECLDLAIRDIKYPKIIRSEIKLTQTVADQLQKKRQQIERFRNNESMVAPDQDSPLNIVNFVDDFSLLKIFSELDVNELSCVAMACQRFNDLAKKEFRSKYSRDRRFSFLYDHVWSLYQVDACFRAFGDELHAFNPSYLADLEIILGMCSEHCPKIEHLQLYNHKWSTVIYNSLCIIVPRLKHLQVRLNGESPDAIDTLFVGDYPMQVLEIHYDWKYFALKLPELIELTYKAIIKLVEIDLERCFLECPKIRKLTLRKMSIGHSVLRLFPKYLPNCQDLTLDCYENRNDMGALIDWQEFKSLTSLHIRIDVLPYAQILTSLATGKVPLKTLSLHVWGTINKQFVLNYLKPLQHLETLKFGVDRVNFLTIDIGHLARELDQLSEVILQGRGMTMVQIISILYQINEPLKISIRIECSLDRLGFPTQAELVLSQAHYDEITRVLRPDTNLTINVMDELLKAPEDVRSHPPKWLNIIKK